MSRDSNAREDDNNNKENWSVPKVTTDNQLITFLTYSTKASSKW